jgi:hypothetical protein
VLRGFGVEEPQLQYAVSHWLQNAVSLPVSLEHPAVIAFRSEFGLDAKGLEDVVDALDINLAVVDDVLSIEAVRLREQDEAEV